MYCGAILQGATIAVVSLLDCHTYSPAFKIRPSLVGLSFSAVRDLFQLLLGTEWRFFISDSRDIQIIDRMIEQLSHWITNGFHPDWTESTAALVKTHEG